MERQGQRNTSREARTVERQGQRNTNREARTVERLTGTEKETDRERETKKRKVETEHKRITVSVFLQYGVLFLKADTFRITKPSTAN